MFEDFDEKYLIRNIAKNTVVLFLGAGASRVPKTGVASLYPLGASLRSLFSS